jgi:hypothetical protein
MAFDKVVQSRIFGVTNQNSDTRMPVGDSSGGTFTGMVNPLKGTLLWDDCMYVLHGVSVAGGATGGSYTITVQTDAVSGYTGLPIASVAGLGRNSASTIVLSNSHQSPGSPLPTHIFVDQTAAGGGIWFQCHVIAKQYRGAFGSPISRTSERIIQGNLLRGTSTAGQFADDRGMTEDATFTLGTTGSAMGLNRLRLWDRAFYWAVAGVSIAGTHDVDIVSTVGGTTFSVASTGTGGALNVAGEKLALASNFFGQSPNPTAIIWTETTAGGVSDARVVVLAKSGRGSMAKS